MTENKKDIKPNSSEINLKVKDQVKIILYNKNRME